VVVRERWGGNVGTIKVDKLRAALTTFPRARSATVEEARVDGWRSEALVQWLREGGRGGYLERITVEGQSLGGWGLARRFIHEALQAGALPSLKRLDASLEYENQRASLTGGFLGGMHELRQAFDRRGSYAEVERQLAALGLVRQLPALATFELLVWYPEDGNHIPVPQWPSFIPPSLRALRIAVPRGEPPSEPLLRALPGMLEASGARLELLEVIISHRFSGMGDGLVHVAQALRCCSPTLKGFSLSTGYPTPLDVDVPNGSEVYADQVERLRVEWADVLAGVSACRELEVLVLPYIVLEPLFPPGTSFARLTHLEMCHREREDPPDAGAVGLWELMASGGLPALAKLSLRLDGRWRGDEVSTRVAPALEAVAGTLTHLKFETGEELVRGDWLSDEVEVGYELGVAVGKLRRLKDLALDLSYYGRVYDAFAQGLAASGGDRPLPLLWRVSILRKLFRDADLLTSLLLPSVRVFRSFDLHERDALVTACALRQAGYKHAWAVRCSMLVHPGREIRKLRGILPLIALCFCRVSDTHSAGPSSPWGIWSILPKGRLPILRDEP
jgi:hypothetical protein